METGLEMLAVKTWESKYFEQIFRIYSQSIKKIIRVISK